MRIYTKAGDLTFSTFTFPDGQPHFKLETYEVDFTSATVETAIKSPSDLLMVLLVAQTLRQHGYRELNLDVRYLMGARMDRAISPHEPCTLQVVAGLINGAGFNRVRVLDVHSEVALRLIRNSSNILPWRTVQQVIHTARPSALVCPDAGAVQRMLRLQDINGQVNTVFCTKKRDMATGNLSGFQISNYNPNPNADGTDLLIVDDICDGGGTFVGLAKELRKAGAKKVYLFVTHGIFSKGVATLGDGGIDGVFTTNSYWKLDTGYYGSTKLTVIPISMKELP
jgi:ribose-phosphate pyrophosphokinase